MSVQPVDVQIFGRSLRVNCPLEQKEALHQAAADLNQRLQDLKERTGVSNTEQLVFITALNMSCELNQERSRIRDYIESIEQRIKILHQTVEQALPSQIKIAENQSK